VAGGFKAVQNQYPLVVDKRTTSSAIQRAVFTLTGADMELDAAYLVERTRLHQWAYELFLKESQLQAAVKTKDHATKRELLAWFIANGADSIAGY
jgi:hypothetical protein